MVWFLYDVTRLIAAGLLVILAVLGVSANFWVTMLVLYVLLGLAVSFMRRAENL